MSNGGAVAEHDTGYKALFSHPEMVADLIRGFVHEEWVRELDFSSLERVPASFVTPGMRRRESDILWRVRLGGQRWVYVYLLLEFQSTVDPFMALRLLVYVGLLYQHLLQEHQLTDSGKLPPVLPLVLYNGYAPWAAALDVADLIEEVPGGLERYRPQLRYCLLDERRTATAELESLRNLAAALFRLEKGAPEEFQRVVAALAEWLNEPQMAELQRTFAVWARMMLQDRIPGAEIPEMVNLEEVKKMLAERVDEWARDWQEQGREQGRREELEKGRAALVRQLEKRFGPLPEEARQRIDALDLEAIVDLSAAAVTAPSLAALGLS